METPKSYYDILKVTPKSSDEDIKRAYRILAKKFHPDHNRKNRQLAEARFRLISEAYAELKTRQKRSAYNRTLRKQIEPFNDNEKDGFFAGIFGSKNRKEKEQQ